MEEDHTHYHGVDKAESHLSVSDALNEFLSNIAPVKTESVNLLESLHRVLSQDVISKVDLPPRARSTRDGYAVHVEDAASVGSEFKIVGDVRIGTRPKVAIKFGEAIRIATGSHIPLGANAVVMKEYTEEKESSLSVSREIKTGENILMLGEDVAKGSIVLKKGESIMPQHISLLTQLGINKVEVYRRPKIAFFSTGDELVDSKRNTLSSKEFGNPKIYDVNRLFIESMISELGAIPKDLGIARDNFQKIKTKMLQGLQYDALILSAGSSVGERDYVSKAVDSIKGVTTLVHGVAMRPSSPTGLAIYKNKPLILLPGFPTSAFVSFLVFGRAAILKLSGIEKTGFPFVRARLLDRYEGKLGITHFVRVKVDPNAEGYTAHVVKPTEAQYSSWMGSANGIAVIDENSSPVEAGSEVNVSLIRELNRS
jgi:molybdenum cofactor synthesis domain-containing protein